MSYSDVLTNQPRPRRNKQSVPNGYILHQDSERVVIVTGTARKSANTKTAGMLQVWILAAAVNPVEAIQTGLDGLICGDCKHRGTFGERVCYVEMKAPWGIYDAFKRGRYPFLPRYRYAEVFAGKRVRFGAYGDPFFIPLDVIRWVDFFADQTTGYTHQWRQAAAAPYRTLLMASVDTAAEYAAAAARGWRTFRVVASLDQIGAAEIDCPASDESHHRTDCYRCGLCNGVRYHHDGRKNIAIVVHGAHKRKFAAGRPNLCTVGTAIPAAAAAVLVQIAGVAC